MPLDICLPTPFALLCGDQLRVFIRGVLIGILSLAGLFNLLLLLANWRNRSHLVFAAISLIAAIATLAPQWMGFWLQRALVPPLLCLFIYVLFPALRHAPASQVWFQTGRLLALWAGLPGLLALTAAALLPDAAGQPGVWVTARLYWCTLTLAALAMLAAALLRRQQGALLLSLGVCAAFGTAGFELFAFAPGFFLIEAQTWIRPSVGGLLVFVLTMVFLMGPNRYRMHRQLSRSRGVLHEANQKLRHLDALKNRYVSSSAREMQAPLEAMLGDCMELVEDPAYRLSPRQLAALSGVMDMARRMIRRNERAARLFESESDSAAIDLRDLAGGEFLNMLAIVLGERHPRLQLHFVDLSKSSSDRLRMDPRLVEAAFEELVENSARHADSAVRGRIVLADSPEADPRRLSLQYRESVQPNSPEPGELRGLVDEFESRSRSGGPAGMGLGLSLVRRIAELHGGRLEIRRHTVNGEHETVFAYSVPVAGQAPRAPELDWAIRHVGALLASGDATRTRQARAESERLRELYRHRVGARPRDADAELAQELERVFVEAGVPPLPPGSSENE